MLYIVVAVVMGYVSWYMLGGNVWVGNAFVLLYCVMMALVEKKAVMARLVEHYDIDEVKVYEPSLNDIFVEYAGNAAAEG